MKRVALATLLGGWLSGASAYCWEAAALRYSLDPLLLHAIADVESAQRADAVHVNADGSRDIGLMQINSFHFARLASQGITERRLLEDPCLSVSTGAQILADFVRRHGYNWTAVGAYNAGSRPERHAQRMRYAKRSGSAIRA